MAKAIYKGSLAFFNLTSCLRRTKSGIPNDPMTSTRSHNALAIATVTAMSVAAIAAGGEPFVFRDVVGDVGLREPLRGMMGHAAAWGDVNGDGWIDLFVGTFADRPAEEYVAGGAAGAVPNQLLLNHDGRFVRSDQPALAWKGRASGSVFADFDNDGGLDLYVSNNGRLGHQNRLYRNRGGGRFEDVTERSGAPLERPETSRSATVLDFDGDGLLDLLVLGTVNRDKTLLFRNRGGMKFEITDAIPADATGLGLACADITGNGWPDVLIGGPNRLFVNLGDGRFREAPEAGLQVPFTREDDASSCGVPFGDIDRDGDPDLLIGAHHKRPWSEPNPIRLFLNLGSTPDRVRFREVTREAGIANYPMKVPHVEIRDFNNDGWPDLYTAVVTFKGGRTHPAIYKNLGELRGGVPQFAETAFVHRPEFPTDDDYHPGMKSGEFYDRLVAARKVAYFAAAPSGDFDNDGRLDLFLGSWWPKLPSLLLRNETPSGNYLDVIVVGKGRVNRMGIGTTVRAYRSGRAGDPAALLAAEEIATAYGFCSAQPGVAHLGLASETACDLVVTLPHGAGTIRRPNIQANQSVSVSVGAPARDAEQ